jgi:hypothetical protein
VAKTRLNPRLAKLHRPYAVDEIARLYGVHGNTVRQWIKSHGLTPLDGGRPIVVMGATLRAFLEARRAKAKRPCPPGYLFCFACHAPRKPALGMADFVPQPKGAGKVTALCEACGTTMHRRGREDALHLILPGVPVRIVKAALRIEETTPPCSTSDLEVTENHDQTPPEKRADQARLFHLSA